MRIKIDEQLKIPDGVEVKLDGGLVTAKGPKGESSKRIFCTNLIMDVKEGKVIMKSENATKHDKTMFYTAYSHIKNMLEGVSRGFVYKLKVCASHFPIKVSIADNVFAVKNFLGEKIPRTVKINPNVHVKIEGDIITVEGADLEQTSQTAANIEQISKVSNRDLRVFQDGIYITSKAGKPIQ